VDLDLGMPRGQHRQSLAEEPRSGHDHRRVELAEQRIVLVQAQQPIRRVPRLVDGGLAERRFALGLDQPHFEFRARLHAGRFEARLEDIAVLGQQPLAEEHVDAVDGSVVAAADDTVRDLVQGQLVAVERLFGREQLERDVVLDR
jgi:hypothetical protein